MSVKIPQTQIFYVEILKAILLLFRLKPHLLIVLIQASLIKSFMMTTETLTLLKARNTLKTRL